MHFFFWEFCCYSVEAEVKICRNFGERGNGIGEERVVKIIEIGKDLGEKILGENECRMAQDEENEIRGVSEE